MRAQAVSGRSAVRTGLLGIVKYDSQRITRARPYSAYPMPYAGPIVSAGTLYRPIPTGEHDHFSLPPLDHFGHRLSKIGRASCRERVKDTGSEVSGTEE